MRREKEEEEEEEEEEERCSAGNTGAIYLKVLNTFAQACSVVIFEK